MKLGFTGTRYGMTDAQKESFKKLLSPMAEFHHGSCQGADVDAARIVREELSKLYVMIIAHPGPDEDPYRTGSGVDDEILPPKTHFARNRDIVDLTDALIATPFDPKEQNKGGTWYTIKYAMKQGKPVTIIWPNGTVEKR